MIFQRVRFPDLRPQLVFYGAGVYCFYNQNNFENEIDIVFTGLALGLGRVSKIAQQKSRQSHNKKEERKYGMVWRGSMKWFGEKA